MAVDVLRQIAVSLGVVTDKGAFAQASALLNGIGNSVRSLQTIGAQVGRVLDVALFEPLDRADQIKSLAQQTGFAAATIQEMGFAAEQSNTSTESLVRGMRALSKYAFDAAKGGKESSAAFAALGVQAKGADGKVRGAEDILFDLTDALKNVENDTERAALSLKFFGRTGFELQPFLAQGSEKIREMRDEARALGLVMDESTVTAGSRLKDTFGKLRGVVRSLGNAAARGLLPHLQKIADGVLAWVRANGELVRSGVTDFFNMAGRAVVMFARLASTALEVVRPVVSMILPLAPALASVAKQALVAAVALWILRNPIKGVGSAFLLALDDVRAFTNKEHSLLDEIFANTEGWSHDMAVLAASALAPFVDKESRDIVLKFYRELFDEIATMPEKTFLRAFRATWSVLKKLLSDGFVWVAESLNKLIPSWVLNLAVPGLGSASEGILAMAGKKPDTSSDWLSTAKKVFAGGAIAPEQAVAQASGFGKLAVEVSAPQTNNINVTMSGTSANPQDVAGEIERILEDRNQEQLRQTYSAFAPAGR